MLWVTDVGLHRLLKVSESGTFLTTASGRQADPASSATDLDAPSGVATDAYGNVWVTDAATNRVLEFSSAGKWLFQFGAPGAGNGQFSQPVGIDVAPSGNLAVVDRGNSRVQVFRPDGDYRRQFGTSGTGNAQFSEAVGLAFGPGNSVVIADAGNKRIARWTHADQDPQSGATKVEIKVDGTTAKTVSPGCTTKNCAITGSWTLKADDYAVGPHKVEVITTDGVGISTSKVLDVETHGDLQAPTIALSGSMTQQATLGTTRPAYTLEVNATDPGGASERKSGVASVSIKIDGQVVSSTSPGCFPWQTCSITRSWTLNSDNYAPGAHQVEVRATDGAGRTATKTLTINIDRDTTAPEFGSLSTDFYSAPKGWLEQTAYDYSASATDTNGYGVTSLQLKIDGIVVDSASGTCPNGACGRYLGLTATIDMSKYDGGAHPAELIAADGAGNWRKKSWTINVVPSDEISRSEAIATMAASDQTSGANTIGEMDEGAEEELPMGGDVPLVEESTGFTAPEAAAPLSVGHSPEEGMIVRIPSDDVTEESCPFVEQELTKEEPSEPVPPEERAEPCDVSTSYGEELIELEPVEITPIQTSPGATDLGVDAASAVAISANVHESVDQLVRPVYNGAQTFTAIRDAGAPVQYSWKVNLEEDQILSLIDPQHAVVLWDSGHTAFTITATDAHDAIGTGVPTSLSVAGDTLTLHVPHRDPSPAGGGYIYPVTAGAGWQGGFQTYEVAMPPPQTPEEAEEVLEGVEIWDNEAEGRIRLISSSPPTAYGKTEDGDDKYHYKFRWSECRYSYTGKSAVPIIPRREMLALYVGGCVKQTTELKTGLTVFGRANMIPGKWVWVNESPRQIDCASWGAAPAAPVNCFARPWKAKYGITLRGDFRLGPKASGYLEGAECVTMYTEIFSKKPYVKLRENIVSQVGARDFFEPCDWPG